MDNSCTPCREKFWNECDVDAKIERMREHVKRLESLAVRHESQIKALMKHSHVDHQLFVPMGDSFPQEIWFNSDQKEVTF